MPAPKFKKHVIGYFENSTPPGDINTLSVIGDINNDGRPDFVVSGRHGRMAWFENTGSPERWILHLVDQVRSQECGGSLIDLTGNGLLDIINGSDGSFDEIAWWENPGAGDERWIRRMIAKTGHKQFHDTIIGDVTGDGRLSLIFDNQQHGTTIYCVPLPEDPTVSPWPEIQVVADGMFEENPDSNWNPARLQPEEGLAIGDIDGDGQNELICGTHWYKCVAGQWSSHKFATGYITTKVAVADVDGDGCNEILLSEGDPVIYGKRRGGKLAWFKPGADKTALWQEHVIDDGLLDAHSLQPADLCGNGRCDLFVAEIGAANRETGQFEIHQPRLFIYENLGGGHFTRHIIDEGTGTHEAVLVDACGNGRRDIVGKPLHGPEKWNLHLWENLGF